MIKHFNRLGQLDANLGQLKNDLVQEMKQATEEVISDFKEKQETFDAKSEEAYLRVVGFNPGMFVHTVENVEGVRQQVKAIIKKQMTEVISSQESPNQSQTTW